MTSRISRTVLCTIACVALGCASKDPPPAGSQEAAAPEAAVVSAAAPADPAPPPSATPDEDPTAAVHATLDAYRKAILADDGQTAAGLVTAGTVRHFDDLRRKALAADRDELDKLNLTDEFTTLLMRHRIPTEELRRMDGQRLLVHAYDNGWVGKNSVMNIQLGKVAIADELATVTINDRHGRPSPLRFELEREDGQWRIDIAALMRSTAPAMNQILTQVDPDPHRAMLIMLERVTGRTYDESAWDPPTG